MRVFISIDVPESIRLKLVALQETLRPASTSARWVPTESIHLTLKFIGQIHDDRLPDIDQALGGLAWKPFDVSVQGVGFFPGARSPRVLWAGLAAPTMKDLGEKIDSRLQRLGYDPEQRVYRPHITLARASDSRLETTLVEASKQFENTDFGSFQVDRCFLYESILKPNGSEYRKLKEYELNAEGRI
jgi:2'-5' RNA ligase